MPHFSRMQDSNVNGNEVTSLDGLLFLSRGPGTQVFAVPVQCSTEQPSAPEAVVVRPKEPNVFQKIFSSLGRTPRTATCAGTSSTSSTLQNDVPTSLPAPMTALRAALRPKSVLQAALERPPQVLRPLLVRPPKRLDHAPPSPPPVSGFPPNTSSLPHSHPTITAHLLQPSTSGNLDVLSQRSVQLQQKPSTSLGPVLLPNHSKQERPTSPPDPRFRGQREVSIFGKHDVLRYNIPGGHTCYIFSYLRSNPDYEVYRCTECMKHKKHTPMKVVGDDFLNDPCLAPHSCTPIEGAKDKVDRLTYKKFQEIRRDPQYAECQSRQVWEDMLEACDDKTIGDQDERNEMKLIFCSTGFEKKRRAIARNLSVHKQKMLTEDGTSSAIEESQEDDHLFETVEFKPSVTYEQLLNGDYCLQDIDLKPVEHLMYGEDEDDTQQSSRSSSPIERKVETISENAGSQSPSPCYAKRIKTENYL